MSSRASTHCVACGPAQASHAFLWFESTTDALTLWAPSRVFPAFLTRLGDGFVSLIGRALFMLGKALGIVTLTGDPETAVSNRSKLLWLEARRRGIPMEQLLSFGRTTDTFRVEIDGSTRFFRSLPLPPASEALRMDDKVLFKRALREAGLPVPRSHSVRNLRKAEGVLAEFSPVCVKPRTGSNGRHTYPHVATREDLRAAFRSVKEVCMSASVEEHLEGPLCRATCVGGKLIGFLECQYPMVTGDGISYVRELVERSNSERSEGVAVIQIDDFLIDYIRRRGHTLDSVLPKGERLPLSYRAGARAGGSNREHGRTIHQSFIEPIERAAVLTGLPIVGFDIIVPDPFSSADDQRWGFIEANSLPWIDLHATPLAGVPIDLSSHVWDLWLMQDRAGGTR